MTAIEQHKLGKVLWAIADKLRGSMMADDFRAIFQNNMKKL